MLKEFKGESHIQRTTLLHVPKDVVEENLIFDFLKQLPINGLKRLLNFQEVDFEDKDMRKGLNDKELFDHLERMGPVEYRMKIDLNV